MMKKRSLLIILFIVIVGSLSSYFLSSKNKNQYYDEMSKASSTTQECFNKIKQYRLDNNIPLSKYDIYESGLIGERFTNITTTGGTLEAKQTATNPNFAGLFVKYFKTLGLKENDEVALLFSGSFPSLNIASIIACQTLKLNTYISCSVTGSNYGANIVDFNFIDMFMYLKSEGLINDNIDICSAGGHLDSEGGTYYEFEKDRIVERIQSYGISYYDNSDYNSNVAYRISDIQSKLPNLKCFMNVGAHTCSVGFANADLSRDINIVGIINKDNFKYNNSTNYGLIEYYVKNNIDVINILHITTICANDNITYHPSKLPDIGEDGFYYDVNSKAIIYPIIGVSLSTILLAYYYIDSKKRNRR